MHIDNAARDEQRLKDLIRDLESEVSIAKAWAEKSNCNTNPICSPIPNAIADSNCVLNVVADPMSAPHMSPACDVEQMKRLAEEAGLLVGALLKKSEDFASRLSLAEIECNCLLQDGLMQKV